MEQKEKKGLKFYLSIIKFPCLVLLVWLLLSSILGMIFPELNGNIVFAIVLWCGIVAAFGFNGFLVTRKVNDGEGGIGAKAGALTGVFCGLVTAIVSLVILFGKPDFILSMVETQLKTLEDMGQTVSREMLENFVKIGMLTSLVTMPLLYGIVGAVVSGVAALIFRKK